MQRKPLVMALAGWLVLMSGVHADEATTLPRVVVEGTHINEGNVVEGDAVDAQRSRTSDAAHLLDGVPGMSFYGGGGVSSLPAIDGLADDRLNIEVNGMTITSSCPNHMNPALSYIDPVAVEKIAVMAGIAPVSLGGDSIGGTIAVQSAPPRFAADGKAATTGSVGAFARSNGHAVGYDAHLNYSSAQFAASYSGATVSSDDYQDGDGNDVASTEYAARNHLVSLAFRLDRGYVDLDLGWQDIPRQGYVNQYMDMTSNRAGSLNLRYVQGFDWGTLDAGAYRHHVRHKMDMLKDKAALGWEMPMDTEGADTGYHVQAELPLRGDDKLRLGHEFHHYTLDDWWPAFMMADQDFWNIRGGKRDRLAFYGEWDAHWSPVWSSQLGARWERVTMDAGAVQGYYSDPMMDMGMYQTDAAAFNARADGDQPLRTRRQRQLRIRHRPQGAIAQSL